MRVDLAESVPDDLNFDGDRGYSSADGRFLTSRIGPGGKGGGPITRPGILDEGSYAGTAKSNQESQYSLEAGFALIVESVGLSRDEHIDAAKSIPLVAQPGLFLGSESDHPLAGPVGPPLLAIVLAVSEEELELVTHWDLVMCNFRWDGDRLAFATDLPTANPLQRVALHLERPTLLRFGDVPAITSEPTTQVAFRLRGRFWNLMASLPDGHPRLVDYASEIVARLAVAP